MAQCGKPCCGVQEREVSKNSTGGTQTAARKSGANRQPALRYAKNPKPRLRATSFAVVSMPAMRWTASPRMSKAAFCSLRLPLGVLEVEGFPLSAKQWQMGQWINRSRNNITKRNMRNGETRGRAAAVGGRRSRSDPICDWPPAALQTRPATALNETPENPTERQPLRVRVSTDALLSSNSRDSDEHWRATITEASVSRDLGGWKLRRAATLQLLVSTSQWAENKQAPEKQSSDPAGRRTAASCREGALWSRGRGWFSVDRGAINRWRQRGRAPRSTNHSASHSALLVGSTQANGSAKTSIGR
ncbi:uncharacterized protein B0H64DRAFT_202866 [Chaetomium fimeti]|uniref:Uncharacterized protein n=1 Tax=Chaetomium fimeti TaxID=1854472 RepID=A0AAE0HAD8_9PEZI|nr:hypothetical protein B0H64DRAFT_202866 [Chaetomium fimeti]